MYPRLESLKSNDWYEFPFLLGGTLIKLGVRKLLNLNKPILIKLTSSNYNWVLAWVPFLRGTLTKIVVKRTTQS